MPDKTIHHDHGHSSNELLAGLFDFIFLPCTLFEIDFVENTIFASLLNSVITKTYTSIGHAKY